MSLIICINIFNYTLISNGESLKNNKKACWVSYQDIYNELRDKNEADFREAIVKIYDNIIANKLDTVIMHVRAMGDAMYPSSFFPWSTYITSDRSNPGYDPLEIMVEIAHNKGLKIEAWINPYRISLSNETTDSYKRTSFYSMYEEFIYEYKNNEQICMVLDPSRQETRDLITNGVKEIIEKYDVDGIHFDDYFYVSAMVDSYPEEIVPSVQTRKDNVNKLIIQVYSTIKAIKPDCEFGISPEGNPENARNQGADIDTWLSQEGYIDYIMPQIYWTDNYILMDGTVTTMFSNRIKDWQAINYKDKSIFVGLAIYRVGEENSVDIGWANASDNLANQYMIAYNNGYDGYALFRYEWLNRPEAQKELNALNNFVDELIINKTFNLDSYVTYVSYVEEYGWQGAKADGVLSGTTGEDKKLEAISISLGNNSSEGGITYRAHSFSLGWSPWVNDGKISGATRADNSMDAIQIKLTGDISKTHDVYYRVYVCGIGWLDFAKNGKYAGTNILGKYIEAIQIIIINKENHKPGNVKYPYIEMTYEKKISFSLYDRVNKYIEIYKNRPIMGYKNPKVNFDSKEY